MRYHIFYNMMAGHGDARAKAKKLSSIFEGDVEFHDVAATSYREFISSTPAEDVIVICGGDGTVNRFANDTFDMEIPNEVLYFPAGSGNDFMHDANEKGDKPFPLKPYLKNLPVAEVKGKAYRFVNNVGFGLDGFCCAKGDDIKETSDKPVNYTNIAIKGMIYEFKPTNATVTVDGKEYRYNKVWIAPTMKGRYYGGGMMAAPNQDRNAPDGKLSVVLFHSKGRLGILTTLPKIFEGEHIKKTDRVTIHTGYEISVKFDTPSFIQIDGETIRDVTEYSAKAKVEAPVKNQI